MSHKLFYFSLGCFVVIAGLSYFIIFFSCSSIQNAWSAEQRELFTVSSHGKALPLGSVILCYQSVSRAVAASLSS